MSKQNQVYVRSFPGPGPPEPVSIDGGFGPAWHPNGREPFFPRWAREEKKYQMFAVEFSPGSPPRIGRPQKLFTFDPVDLGMACGHVRCFDVGPDGKFYTVWRLAPPSTPKVTQINLIQNWFEELRAKVPRQQPVAGGWWPVSRQGLGVGD